MIQFMALLKQQIPSDASSGQNKNTGITILQQELERQRQEFEQREEESKQRHDELMDLFKEQQKENKRLVDLLSKG